MPGSSTRVQHKDFFIWITFLFLSLQNSANKLPHAERTIVLSKFVKLLSRISKVFMLINYWLQYMEQGSG